MVSQSDMSVCEQSFHFSNAPKGNDPYSSNFNLTAGGRGKTGGNITGAMGSGAKSTTGSMLFANLDDA